MALNKYLIGAAIAFGIAFFLVLIGMATTGMVGNQYLDNTTRSALFNSATGFLGMFSGIIGIGLLVAAVLDELGIKEAIRNYVGSA